MATIFMKRLRKKYGTENISGNKYRELMSEILANNSEKTARAVGRLSADNYENSLKRLKASKRQIVKLPDLSDVLPKRSVFLGKAAESGQMISETLRSQLEKDLRETLKEFDGTGQERMEIQRGRTTGKMNPNLVLAYQKRIEKTYQTYTKRDPKTGTPPSIKNIAVTEIRSTIGEIKEAYKSEILKRNPGAQAVKTWVHNAQLSKKPRIPHMKISGTTIPDHVYFFVDRKDGSGFDKMMRPHDPNAPANQVIGCNCDLISRIVFPGGKE